MMYLLFALMHHFFSEGGGGGVQLQEGQNKDTISHYKVFSQLVLGHVQFGNKNYLLHYCGFIILQCVGGQLVVYSLRVTA